MFHHNLLIGQNLSVQYPSHRVRSHDAAVCAANKYCRVKVANSKGKHSGRSTGAIHGGEEATHRIDAHVVVLFARDEGEEGVAVRKNGRAHSGAV